MKNFILKKFSLKNFTLKNFKRYVPASATVEAALVIPLVIYAVAAVMFLLQVIAIKMHVSDALYNALRKFNTYSYVNEATMGNINGSTFFAIFVDEVGAGYAGKHYIAGGNAGWNFYNSRIADDDSTVGISLVYTIKNPFNIFGGRGITVREERITDIWLGEDKDGFSSQSDEKSEYVYITQYGEVYHTDLACTYLRRDIKTENLSGISELRNNSGAKYYRCTQCNGESLVVYYTDYGDKYHMSADCYTLQRTILRVKKDKVQSMESCIKCSQS